MVKKTKTIPFPKRREPATKQTVTGNTLLKKVKDIQALVLAVVKDAIDALSKRLFEKIDVTFKSQFDTLQRISQRMEASVGVMKRKGLITEDEILEETDVVQLKHQGIAEVIMTTSTFEERVRALKNWNENNLDHLLSAHDVEIPAMIMAAGKTPEDIARMCDEAEVAEIVKSRLIMYSEMETQANATEDPRHIDAGSGAAEKSTGGEEPGG